MKKISFKHFLIISFVLIAAVSSAVTASAAIHYINSSINLAYNSYEDAMNLGYNTEIKSQVQAAIAVIESFYNKSLSGELTEDAAKYEAKEAIRAMRYRDDKSGYMWIDSVDYTLIMHPILPQNEGSNRYSLEDQNGVMIIQEIIKTAQNGGGCNSFYFTKADGVTVALKIAYSEEFSPWGWVITTGNYVDDMEADMAAVKNNISSASHSMIVIMVSISAVLIAAAILISIFAGKLITNPLKQLELMAARMSVGDISQDAEISIENEIGKTALALNTAQENIKLLVHNIFDVSEILNEIVEDFDNSFSMMGISINSISSSADDISANVAEQAGFTQTVSDDVDVIGCNIAGTVAEMHKLDANARNMNLLGEKSVLAINELTDINTATLEQIRTMYEQTSHTDEAVSKILLATDIINDIAEQTDLLALNASIEAARAGEAGKGFSVVAEQIGSLARQSATSASEIDTIVKELLANSKLSMNLAGQINEHINKQSTCINAACTDFSALSNGINECIASIRHVNTMAESISVQRLNIASTLTRLNEAARNNASATAKTSAMSAELLDMVKSSQYTINSLVESIQKLTEDVTKFKI